ncbi:hypothetical protein DPMN_061845 [Dreissena polymorpha]|uniref:Uncharacterized protein n=1 Tax=Dreissena polymorpha TaxID=45954 RepID=A0A9D4C8B8_DREPO|nr:hypothetical protein DPMN_061845 [Dreissena polymorpha]
MNYIEKFERLVLYIGARNGHSFSLSLSRPGYYCLLYFSIVSTPKEFAYLVCNVHFRQC